MTSMTAATPTTTEPAVTQPQPLAQKPIAPYKDGQYGRDEDGNVNLCGHCSPLCASDGPWEGQSVKTHGVWCESPAIGFCDALAESGHELGISVEDVTGYAHGTYPYEYARRSSEEYVRVGVWQATTTPGSSTRDAEFFLTVGEAYRLAAVLTRAAQVADHLDVPVKRASWVKD